MPKKTAAQLNREIAEATATTHQGKWEVEAGRGLVFAPKGGEPPKLMFNLHRHVDKNGNSAINPSDLDKLTHEIAAFLNRSHKTMPKWRGY
jgi:hypothetical protein